MRKMPNKRGMKALNRKGLVINMTIILILAVAVAIAAFGLYGIILAMISQFQLGIQCAFGVATKSILQGLYVGLGVNTLPLPNVKVQSTCLAPVVPIKQAGAAFDDNLNVSLGTLLTSCWHLFGAGKQGLVFDEGRTLACFDVIMNADHNVPYKGVAEYLNESFFEITSMKVVFVKSGAGDIAEFIDPEIDFIPIGTDIPMQIIYSDWETLVPRGGVFFFLDFFLGPQVSSEAIACYLDSTTRYTEAQGANQYRGVVNTYTEYGGIDQIGMTNTELGPCALDPLAEFCYYQTACGCLLKSMVCCEDKMFICMP